MTIKISDLMHSPVFTLQRHHTVARARKLMTEHSISAIPIVGPEDELAGIVSKTDLLSDHADATPLSQIMAEHAWAVPQYNDASAAARVMRKHAIHHVVVTHEKKVIGLVSSFDLLQLVEDHRFVMKPGAKSNA
jgi:CBS domain-containing protein